MVTVIVYLVIVSYLVYLVFRLLPKLRDKPNPFTKYFFGAVLMAAIGQTLNLILIGVYYYTDNREILYWADYIGRMFLYLTAAFFVQMPLYVFFPKSKARILVSYFFAGLVPIAAYFYLRVRYLPFVDELGIIRWETPDSLTVIPGVIMILILLSASAVFLFDYWRSEAKSKKPLFIGSGLFLIAIGAVAQDFVFNTPGYVVVHAVLLAGFVLQFMSLLVEKESDQTVSKGAS